MVIKKHIIHLEHHTQRKADFLAMNAASKDFVWTAAIPGAELDRRALIASGILAADAQLIDGSLGNAVSVIHLLKQCVETNEIMSILEDDAILSHHFDSCSLRLLESIDFDFDLVQWGWNFDSVLRVFPMSPAMGPVEMTAHQGLAQKGFRRFQEWKCPRTLLPLGHQWGTHCFTVTPRGAKHILGRVLPLSTEAFDREDLDLRIQPRSLDSMIGRCYPDLKAYACFPPLSMVLNDKANSTIWPPSHGRKRGLRRLRDNIKKLFARPARH
jgi:glycosyl transferase, family 25